MREERPDLGVPLLEELRDGRTQAVHNGHAVLLDRDGHIDHQWGHGDEKAYWRSALKPLQAIPFLETGAFESLGLDERHLAIACASHNGEKVHVELARGLLKAAGQREADLACGAHEPMGFATTPELCGAKPAAGWGAIHNNCSGKHAAMLATAKHNGWPTQGYLDPEHPLQLAIRRVVADATQEPVVWGTDGCSAPTFWTTLTGMARAFQWLHRRPEGRLVFDAMTRQPHFIAGTGMWDTAFLGAGRGRFVGKVGAAGLYVALDRKTGEAFACKVASGSSVARDQVAAHLALDSGWLDDEAQRALDRFLKPAITTWRGVQVGSVRSFV
jgi:L-asparaginase II